jgi:PKHD-type hydroxylase
LNTCNLLNIQKINITIGIVAAQGHGKLRKLSVVISLSDPKDYEGGDFEFQFRGSDDPTLTKIVPEIKPKGSVLVFPSYIWHRVKPITKGLRYSLVAWVRGNPYR